jgi:hypothetical protein
MKYRELPLEKELEAVRADRGDEAMEVARAQHVDALLRHPGFQIIVTLLRDVEASALRSLRNGNGNAAVAAARIHTVDLIRRAIEGIVPQPPVDWGDEELEEFMPPDVAEFE